MKLTPGEKLIVYLLCDIHEKLGIKGDINPILIKDAILDGQMWSLDWEYGNLFAEEINKSVLDETLNILDMWRFIEEGFERLSSEEQKTFATRCPYVNAKFSGFDGNNENEYKRVALFLIDKMKRYQKFIGRDLDCHSPSLDRHRSRYQKFEPLRATLHSRLLNLDEIISILS